MAGTGDGRAALGLRDHTGWAACVVAGGSARAPIVFDRRRIELCGDAVPGHAYHAARDVDGRAAAALVRRAAAEARRRARAAIRDVLAAGARRGLDIVAIAVRDRPGALPDDLAAVLASHALVHAAEGVLYREALADAAGACGLPVVRVDEDRAYADAAGAAGTRPGVLRTRLDGLRAELGPPWQRDHKDATAAALAALAALAAESPGQPAGR